MTSAAGPQGPVGHATTKAPSDFSGIGIGLAILLSLAGPIIVWSTSVPSFLEWTAESKNLTIATISAHEIRDLIYSAVATLGFGILMAVQIIANPAKLRTIGTLIGMLIVLIAILVIFAILGGTFPWLPLLGLACPVVGTIVQDQLSGK
ncbi:hypothetical protein [Leucobacter sp. W1478]|uniref:hypothetical protein n=1 Tax=Leucobacter sp. W1478 TaxID=3439065 RepID=UPI003F2AC617